MTTCQQIKYDSIISFPRSSFGKEPACNAEDLGSVPGSGRSPGEGNGNPLQYSCLGNPMDRGAWQAAVYGVAKSDTTEAIAQHSTAQLFAKPPPSPSTVESRFPDHLIEGAPSLFFSIGVFYFIPKTYLVW